MSPLQSVLRSASLSPYGDLGLLPPEIRAMIYALVFAAGRTALARSSKALHAETWDALHRYGALCVHVNSDFEDWDGSGWHWEYLKHVQNVRIRVSLPFGRAFELEPDSKLIRGPLEILSRLVKAIEKPKMCHVQVCAITSSGFTWDLLRAMVWMRNFERVDVEVFDLRKNTGGVLSKMFDHGGKKADNAIRRVLCPNKNSKKKPKVAVVRIDTDIYSWGGCGFED